MKRSADNRALLGLFRVLTLLILCGYIGAVAHLWHQNLSETRSSLAYINSMLVQGVRTTLKGHELVLRGLGHELVRLGSLDDPELGRELIERMRLIDPGMAGFGLARADGQLVLVSGIGPGKPLPSLAQRSEARDSFAEVLESPHLRTGRPYYFASLGHWVVPIRVAIRDAAGSILAVMTAGYTIDSATTAWTNLQLPPKVSVSLIRDDGYKLYKQPLPDLPRADALKAVYGKPHKQDALLSQAPPPDSGLTVLAQPESGSGRYIAYTRISEYALHAGAYIQDSAVIQGWLRRLLAPTALLLMFLVGGGLAYRRASQQQASSDAEIGQLTAWQQAMLDGADYSIVSTDVNGTIVSFNKAAQRLLGYRPEELVGRHTPEIIHDQKEVVERAAELSRALGKPIAPGFEIFVAKARYGHIDEREWTYVRKDGSHVPVLLSVTAMTAPDGDVIGFLGIADDLSEQKAIRANLRDSEARYKTLFEHAGDAIFLMRDGRFVDCNPATLDLFACTREQIIGATPGAFSPPIQPDQQASAEKAGEKLDAAVGGEPQFFEWRHMRMDGSTFDAEVTLNAVEIAGQPHIHATVRDISERKRNETELTQSRQALIERNNSLRLLNQLSQRLHGTLALEGILRETVRALVGLDHSPHVAIYLLDESKAELQLVDSHGFDATFARLAASVPLHGSLSELALAKEELHISPDVTNDERIHPDIRTALTGTKAKSGFFIPMICQGEALGSIVLLFEDEQQLTASVQETLLSLSNTVGLAITNARQMDNLEFQARHDGLTQLPNRAQLHETFSEHLDAASSADKQVTLMLLDLDRFKDINDTLGHHIGDQVLTQVGPRLSKSCRGQATLIARLGGDEFAILFIQDGARVHATDVAKAIIETLRQPFLVESVELHIGASIGIARYPDHGEDSHALLRAADVAMYQAKKLSAGIMVYDDSFDDYSAERLALASELMQAIELEQLVLHYQPKIDINRHSVVGFEALVRWQHPRLGLLYPGDFITLVEVSEVIHPFTRAVMQLAVADKRRLKDLGYDQPVAINMSVNNLIDASSFSNLMDAVFKHDLPATEVELELTETALMHDQENAAVLLQQFSDAGVNIAIDDFGTGYSSLSYLRQLPITALKIDRSFVADMLTDQQDSTIVRSTIALAHNLSLNVIAEGVEDEETLAMLRAMGCDQAQGFVLCRPQPMEQLIDWLAENHRSESISKGS